MKRKCPYCGSDRLDWEEVHIGVGVQQVSAARCYDCGAQEVGPFEDDSLLTDEEKQTGWLHGPDPDCEADDAITRYQD